MGRWAAIALALLVATVAAAWAARPTDYRPCRGEGRSRICVDPGSGGASSPPPLWSLLPPSGAGAPVMDPSGVCDAFAGELVGNFVCLRGDGTSRLGVGMSLTSTGAVTTTTPRICPNGTDCSPVTVQSFDGTTAQLATNTIPTPAGDYSMCAVMRNRIEGRTAVAVALSGTTHLLVGHSSSPTLAILKVSGLNVTATLPTASGGWVFVCGTYQRIGGGSNNIGITYVNGAAGNTNSTLTPPDGTAIAIGPVASPVVPADIALAIYTEKVLSPATIAAMNAKVFGTAMTAEDGSAVTFARNSVATCETPDGVLQPLRAGWPCITKPNGFGGGALQVEGARTNAILRSEEFNNGWTQSQATTTPDAILAPNGTLTADTITDNVSASTEHSVSRTITLAAGNNEAVSVYAKAGTRAFASIKYHNLGDVRFDLTTGASATASAAVLTSYTVAAGGGWWRLVVVIKAANTVANPILAYGLAGSLATTQYPGDGTGTIHLWGAQAEVGSFPSSYIRADGTAASRQATVISLTAPAGMTDAQGCAGADVLATGSGSEMRIVGVGAGNEKLIGIGTSAADIEANDGTTTASVTGASATAGMVRAVGEWSGPNFSANSSSTKGTAVPFDGSLPSISSTYHLGASSAGASPLFGWLSNVELGDKPNACN